MSQKILYIGTKHQKGISKKRNPEGVAYDMGAQFVHLIPRQQIERENISIDGVGFEEATIQCSNEVFQRIATDKEIKPPCHLIIDVQADLLNRNQMTVMDYSKS
jgi:hypothetical protein